MEDHGGNETVTSIIQSVSDPMIALDASATVTEWNEPATNLFGYCAPEAIGESLIDLFSLQGISERRFTSLRDESGAKSQTGTENSVRITALGASGEELEIEFEQVTTNPTVLIARPVEQLIPETGASEFFDVSVYRLAIELSTDLIAASDNNERLLFANERYRNFHGLNDQVVGSSLSQILSPETYDTVEPLLDRVLEGETIQFEMERTGPDGTDHVLDVRYYPLETHDGTVHGTVATMREITELKRRAQSLRNSWETYRELVEGIPHPLILHEKNGDILEVNEAASRLLESTAADLGDTNLRELLVSDRAERPFNRLKEGDSDEEFFETECQTAEGNTIPVDVAATRVEYFGSESILTVVRDISEQKAHERELERTNARLQEFAAIVSQDIRNPLTVAKGWVDIAREKGSIEPLQQVAASLDRMDHVIDYTLTLARRGEGLDQLSKIDLGTLVANCWRAAETGSATLQNDVELTIRGDRGRVSHLFETLFQNCTDFGESDDSIRVAELKGRTGFSVENEDVTLPDGMAEVESAHIGSEELLDCDLVVVQRIAKAHGWRMRLVNEDSTGLRLDFSGVEVPENQ